MHGAEDEVVEEVDALPVVAEPAGRVRRVEADAPRAMTPARTLPVVQAAAVAAGSFAAGAIAAAVVHHQATKRSGRGLGRRPVAPRGLPISSSRRFVIDVHSVDPRR